MAGERDGVVVVIAGSYSYIDTVLKRTRLRSRSEQSGPLSTYSVGPAIRRTASPPRPLLRSTEYGVQYVGGWVVCLMPYVL